MCHKKRKVRVEKIPENVLDSINYSSDLSYSSSSSLNDGSRSSIKARIRLTVDFFSSKAITSESLLSSHLIVRL